MPTSWLGRPLHESAYYGKRHSHALDSMWPKGRPQGLVEARYVDIVAERRVVWTETIHEVDKLLAINITTLELLPDGQRTRLKVTVQVTSFVGPGMIKNTKAGHEALVQTLRYRCGRCGSPYQSTGQRLIMRCASTVPLVDGVDLPTALSLSSRSALSLSALAPAQRAGA